MILDRVLTDAEFKHHLASGVSPQNELCHSALCWSKSVACQEHRGAFGASHGTDG